MGWCERENPPSCSAYALPVCLPPNLEWGLAFSGTERIHSGQAGSAVRSHFSLHMDRRLGGVCQRDYGTGLCLAGPQRKSGDQRCHGIGHCAGHTVGGEFNEWQHQPATSLDPKPRMNPGPSLFHPLVSPVAVIARESVHRSPPCGHHHLFPGVL